MIESLKKAYFIGIGGIGMSALARYLNHNGVLVSGYDRDQTPLIQELESEGIAVYNNEDLSHISDDVDIVIYTPAIPDTHIELEYCKNSDIPLYKRSEALKEILLSHKVIAVAGTHGKTSTSAVLSHMLYSGGIPMTGFVGGIMKGYESNFLHSGNDWIVVEADEYDRSFLRLYPTVAIIQAMDADHLDIYGDKQALIDSFKEFTLQIVEGGSLWVKHDISDFWSNSTWHQELVEKGIEINSFGYQDDQSSFQSSAMSCERGLMTFNFGEELSHQAAIQLPGLHNLYNTTASLAVASQLGLNEEALIKGVESFKGIRRRYDIVHRSEELAIIDDYAHHPVEIKAAIQATRENFRGERLTVLFQPHLFSRTNDFHIEFAQSLDTADEVILLPIYPARELPMEGVTSELIYKNMQLDDKKMNSMEEWISGLDLAEYELLLVLGAGDISKLIPKILNKLK